jgi:hypothetical protein
LSSSNLVSVRYKKETTYGELLAAVKASKVIQDLTYTAVKGGEDGNSITIQYTNTATAGSETCVVTGTAIVIGIQSGTSTATQVRTKFNATAAAVALASCAVSGTAGTAQTTVAATPLTGGLYNWKTARFINEKYSGTPDTTESQQIRTDRMSSGQVVTGLTVGGGHSFELAAEDAIEDFLESAFSSAWDTTSIVVSATLAIDTVAKTITRGSGDWSADGVVVGDVLELSSFVDTTNNVPIMVTELTSATVIKYAGASTMVTASEAAVATRANKLEIGTTKKSLSIEKCFTDLTTKAILYKGMMVSQMELNVEYGNLISGSFDLSGNDYDTADSASEFGSYLEYISDPATTESLNGSVDMPFLTTNVTGSFAQDAFCIQSLKLNMNNNLTTQTCIGRASPENYSLGTAQIKVNLNSYLKDSNWDMLARKLSQDSFALGFIVKNTDGWYGVYMPAVQVSFDDPSSGGQNQDVSMEMTGTAKVGSGSVSALVMYRSAS